MQINYYKQPILSWFVVFLNELGCIQFMVKELLLSVLEGILWLTGKVLRKVAAGFFAKLNIP